MGHHISSGLGCSFYQPDPHRCTDLFCHHDEKDRTDRGMSEQVTNASVRTDVLADSYTPGGDQLSPAYPSEHLIAGKEPCLAPDALDGKSSSGSTPPKRHLVLNMDINKTIIMSDKVSAKTVEMVANEVVSNCAWGIKMADGKWVLTYPVPSTLRPEKGDSPEEFISYAEWLEQQFPGSEHKKTRTKLNGKFCEPDQPGVKFAHHVQRMCGLLKRPDGSDVKIIPAFFELLLSLKREKRSFTLCFRTFGADLGDVADELNSFCEGRHPYYPGVRMDGSDGEPDYRFYVSDKETCGTFHRENDVVSLVMGTQEQPGEGKYRDVKDRSLLFYNDWPDLQVITGFEAVSKFLWDVKFSRHGTVGLRDYFAFWKAKKMTSEGGKMFFFDTRRKSNRHEVFFDDNITFDEGYIVQPVCMRAPHARPMVAALLDTHLCRAEPLLSIVDARYFCSELQRLEEGYEKKLTVRSRLGDALGNIAKDKAGVKILREETDYNNVDKDYDPFAKKRKLNSRLSLTKPDLSEARHF